MEIFSNFQFSSNRCHKKFRFYNKIIERSVNSIISSISFFKQKQFDRVQIDLIIKLIIDKCGISLENL